MTSVPFNQYYRQPYLKVQWLFPNTDVKDLSSQMDKAYVDIATKVNERIIGIYPVNTYVVTGEKWVFQGSNQIQQSLRRVYQFTSSGNIPHGLTWTQVSMISHKSYGSFTDGSNWYGCIYASNVAISGQVSFYVTNTNIVVLSGGGAPSITSGFIDLEFVSIT